MKILPGIAGVLGSTLLSVGLAAAQTTMRVSASSAGVPASNFSFDSDMSADGSRVVFGSFASNLTQSSAGPFSSIFLYERSSGTLSLVSLSNSGQPAKLGCFVPKLSAAGRYVAFASMDGSMTPGDYNGARDVFVRDLQANLTVCGSVNPLGIVGNLQSLPTGISDDGRFLSLESMASDLVPNDTNSRSDVFMRDLAAGTTTLASVSTSGAAGNEESAGGGISGDGRFVVFSSMASDLVAGDTNGVADIFVRDVLLGATQRVSVSSGGTQASSSSASPSISRNGRFVCFSSFAPNLVPGDTNGAVDTFVFDRQTGAVERVSLSSTGVQADLDSNGVGSISRDGRYASFTSLATNLVSTPDANGRLDVFVRDRQTNTTWRASQNSLGSTANGESFGPAISDDGQTVAYASDASNLVAGDANILNAYTDIFLTSAQPLGIVTSFGNGKLNSLGCVSTIATSGFPRASGDDAFKIAATLVLNTQPGIFLWGRQAASLPFGGGTLLVGPPIVRTPGQYSGGFPAYPNCGGALTFHFTQAYMASKNVLPGSAIYGQFLSRDPGLAAPDRIGLSDAVQFFVTP